MVDFRLQISPGASALNLKSTITNPKSLIFIFCNFIWHWLPADDFQIPPQTPMRKRWLLFYGHTAIIFSRVQMNMKFQ